MSEVSRGPGWWLASDGRWYGPEQSPGPGPPPVAPPYGYGYPQGFPYTAGGLPPRTNGLAVASFVCSFLFWLYGIGAVLAVVFGFIARSQIKRSGGSQKGSGLALAGIIIGITSLVLTVILVVVVVALVRHHCHTSGDCTVSTSPSDVN